MRLVHLLFTVSVCVVLLLSPGKAQPSASLGDLLMQTENTPRIMFAAREQARQAGLPVSLSLPERILIQVLAHEGGRPVYGVITNPAHPVQDGWTAFYEEIAARYDLSRAVDLEQGPVIHDPNWRKGDAQAYLRSGTGLFLVPDWTADRVLAFDPLTGNLVDPDFIPSTPSALASPKEALGSPRGTITVSDQITDAVQDFDTSGAWLGIFAPAGGVNTSILDNIRGHAYRPSNRNLLVTVASGANAHAIAQFDSAGNYIGNFIANGAGGMNSPFGILFRAGDVLITQSSSPTGVQRYDLNGGFLSQWAAITSFPQQIIALSGDTIAVANFSGTGQTGIRLYDGSGTFLRLLSGVTGNRGVARIGNGNLVTTNGAGIHEIDFATGNLVRTIMTGANFQYISLYVPQGPTSVGGSGSGVPSEFSLGQNYPNPFNPSTTIGYALSRESRVRLTVYDVLGQVVRTVVDEVQGAGRYERMWDGRNHAGAEVGSGMYFYRIEARTSDGTGSFTEMKKMILVR